jgi:hypothetical protein
MDGHDMKFNEETFIPNENTVWKEISKIKGLSENFIHKYKDFVHWDWISASQKLSEEFICEHRDFVYWL